MSEEEVVVLQNEEPIEEKSEESSPINDISLIKDVMQEDLPQEDNIEEWIEEHEELSPVVKAFGVAAAVLLVGLILKGLRRKKKRK